MKKFIVSLTLIMVVTVILFSCRKNEKLPVTEETYDSFVNANKAPWQLFSVNAAQGGTIIGARGTKITFPPNAFANMNNTIATGTVAVSLQEVLDKSQWVMEGVSTTTFTAPLVSGGMINIVARSVVDGTELKAAAAMAIPTPSLVGVIRAEVPRLPNRPDALLLFLPNPNVGVVGATTPLNWVPSQFPFTNTASTYVFQLPQFRWANCDALYNIPGAKTTITVTPDLSAVTNATEIKALLVFKNITTVITLPWQNNIYQSYTSSITIGNTADVVCTCKNGDGKLLFAVLPNTIFTANMNITIKPVVTSVAVVQAYLNSIN